MDVINELNQKIDKLTEAVVKNGGKGSGNFGHSGRPGEVGGSGKGDKAKEVEEISKLAKETGLKKEDIEDYLSDKENLEYRKESVKELKDALDRVKKAKTWMAEVEGQKFADEYYKERIEDLNYSIQKGEERLSKLERLVSDWERIIASWKRLK